MTMVKLLYAAESMAATKLELLLEAKAGEPVSEGLIIRGSKY